MALDASALAFDLSSIPGCALPCTHYAPFLHFVNNLIFAAKLRVEPLILSNAVLDVYAPKFLEHSFPSFNAKLTGDFMREHVQPRD